MCRAADNRYEPTFCVKWVRAERDPDGGGAGEGAGDGGAEVVTMIIVIITIFPWAAVALDGGSIIDFHPVVGNTTTYHNFKKVEGEGECLFIG